MLGRLRRLYSNVVRIFSWVVFSKHASLAIADQATISISSFILTAIIARKAGVDVLGAFSVVLVLSTFGGAVTGSLINAPGMVLFPSMHAYEARYRSFLFIASVAIGALLAIGLSIIYAAYREHIGGSFAYPELFAAATLFIVIPVSETLRRAAFARRRGWAGLRISLIRSVPPPVLLYFSFLWGNKIQLLDIIWVVAAANAASIFIELTFERLQLPDSEFTSANIRRHWHSSRWLLLSAILNSGYTDIFTLATGFIYGDRAVAAIRISQQIFGIVVAGMQTFENTLPLQLARFARDVTSEAYRSFVKSLAAVVFCSLAMFCGLLWWFGNELVRFIFQFDYSSYSILLLFWAGSTACGGARAILAMSYRVIEYTKPIFIADACAFLTALVIVFPVLQWLGVIGSGAGMLITNVSGASVLLALMPRHQTPIFTSSISQRVPKSYGD